MRARRAGGFGGATAARRRGVPRRAADLAAEWPRVPVFAVHTSVSPAPTKIRAFIELTREAAARILDP